MFRPYNRFIVHTNMHTLQLKLPIKLHRYLFVCFPHVCNNNMDKANLCQLFVFVAETSFSQSLYSVYLRFFFRRSFGAFAFVMFLRVHRTFHIKSLCVDDVWLFAKQKSSTKEKNTKCDRVKEIGECAQDLYT